MATDVKENRKNIKVIIRAKPLSNTSQKSCIAINGNKLQLKSDKKVKEYSNCFSHIYDQSASQESIYEDIGPEIVDAVLGGYNSCVFAYGQTGCFAPGTQIYMYDIDDVDGIDCTTKSVENVQIGDYVLGPDHKSRTIRRLYSGSELMYEISSHHAIKPIVVNASHFLVVYCSLTSRTYEIMVKHFIELPKFIRKYCFCMIAKSHNQLSNFRKFLPVDAEIATENTTNYLRHKVTSHTKIDESLLEKLRTQSYLVSNIETYSDIHTFYVYELSSSSEPVQCKCDEPSIVSTACQKCGSNYYFGRYFAPVIRCLDIGQYYGFELDGDHKFIGEGYHLLRNSGKTHTMMGTETNRGLIPRICETLFAKKDDDLHIELSYIEIYKDNIRDLLDKSLVNKGSLLIRQHPVYGVYVESVRKIVIRDYSELQSCLLIGIENRATGSTKMNNQSSRSHAIMTLYLSKIKTEKREIITKLHLIDLAGSEDSRVTGVSKDQLSESVKINLSLTILRRVLATIVEKQTQKKSIHVPFHDSKLTHFLKESLGGNSCTYMIANVSSDPTYERDTKNTLDYANIASKVINTARVIEVNPEEAIETLKKEIDILRMQLKNNENKTNSSVDINRLKEELHVKECLYNEKEKTWEHKLNESQTELERIRQEQELREQEHKREINVFSAELDKKSRENADLSAELSQLKQRILANNDARIMVSPSNSRSRSSSLPPVTLEDVKNLEKLIMEKSASNDFYEIKIQEHKQTIEQLKKTNEELKDEIAKRDMTIEISTEQFRQERMILHHKIEQLKSKISRMEKSEDNGTEILYIEYDELKRKYDADSKKHDELLNEIKTSNTKIENNRELLSQLIEKNEDAKRETESLDAKLFEIKEKYKIIQDNIEQAKQEYETILKKKDQLENSISQIHKSVEELISTNPVNVDDTSSTIDKLHTIIDQIKTNIK